MQAITLRAPVAFTITNANAHALIAGFSREARLSGWTETQIEEVTSRAMRKNYQLLQCTLAEYCVEYLTNVHA